MDPYQVLGVSSDASDETIAKAYKKLAKQYHPDIHPDDERASQKMSKINQAYDRIKEMRTGGSASSPYRGYDHAFQGLDRAETLVRAGRFFEALHYLRNINDKTARWHFLVSVCYGHLGQFEQANVHIEAALSEEPDHPEYNQWKATLAQGYQSRGNRSGLGLFGLLFKIFFYYMLFRFIVSFLFTS